MTKIAQTLAASILALSAVACVARTPADPEPPEEAPSAASQAAASNPAAQAMPHACIAGYIGEMGVFQVPMDERNLRVSLEEHVGALNGAMRASVLAGRAGTAWIEHTPCYRIVASVIDLSLADQVRALADPAIRPYLDVQRTAMTEGQWHALQDRVGDILVAEKLAFTAGFDPITDRIIVTLPSDAAIARARSLIEPADMRFLTIQRGTMPVPL